MNSAKLLKHMMGFRPVSDDIKSVNALVDFTNAYLKKGGLITRIEKLDGRKILYASPVKGKAPGTLFNAHLDVVPADEKVFKIRQRGNVVYGRGAGDCLGNCAMLSNLLLRTARKKPDIGAIFSTDEETGGETTSCMVKRGYKGRFIIILDGGAYRVATAQKGVITVKLTAKGCTCHGSTPWRGENAIDNLIEGYQKVKKLFPEVKVGNEWHTTMSANVVNAGTVFNQVPGTAEMLLDIRHTEKTVPARLVTKLKKASGVKVTVIREQPLVFCNEKAPELLELVSMMKKRLHRNIDMVRMNGATDARHFAKLKAPTAIIGVPGTGAHTAKERVNTAGMKKYEDMLVEMVLKGRGNK